MNPEIEREYMALIEAAEAYFGSQVRWSGAGRIEPTEDGDKPRPFAERWLVELEHVRYRQSCERTHQKAMHAGG